MALFHEHVTFGAVLAVAGVTLLYFYAIVTDPILLVLLCIATVVGSFLPDLDSDSGTPFRIVFGAFTLLCTGAVLYYMLAHEVHNIYYLVGAPVAALFFVWVVVGSLLKNFTRHRGMMHSIPALSIAALITFLAARYLEQGDMHAFLFAGAVGVGFASHLLLDEIHSENIMDGNPFTHKRSLGTALKLFSSSGAVNLFTYLLLLALLYTAYTHV